MSILPLWASTSTIRMLFQHNDTIDRSGTFNRIDLIKEPISSIY